MFQWHCAYLWCSHAAHDHLITTIHAVACSRASAEPAMQASFLMCCIYIHPVVMVILATCLPAGSCVALQLCCVQYHSQAEDVALTEVPMDTVVSTEIATTEEQVQAPEVGCLNTSRCPPVAPTPISHPPLLGIVSVLVCLVLSHSTDSMCISIRNICIYIHIHHCTLCVLHRLRMIWQYT